MKTKIEAAKVEVDDFDYNISFSLRESASERVWHFRLDRYSGIQFLSDGISNVTKKIKLMEFRSEEIICSSFDYGSGEVEEFEFKVIEKESILKIREVYKNLVGSGFRVPDASDYNPSPEWLKFLVSRTGISRAEIAIKLGVSLRGLDFNLMDANSKNHRQMPYTSQFSIECLIPEVRFFKSLMLLA